MAQYTVIRGREGFLGRGQFGVVEKVVKDSSGEVSTPELRNAFCTLLTLHLYRSLHAKRFAFKIARGTVNRPSANT